MASKQKRNAQPFYHRAVVLFTATREISLSELQEALRGQRSLATAFPTSLVGADTITVEECDAEPGDPADLV